jgi:hypothetical protein
MEIYVNGELDVFIPMTGQIQQTGKDLTLGHKDRSTNSYYLRGTLDEIKIFTGELPVSQIKTLNTLWNPYTGLHVSNAGTVQLFPNPAEGFVYLRYTGEKGPFRIEACDITGQQLEVSVKDVDKTTLLINMIHPVHGVVLIKILFRDEQKVAKVFFQ